MSVTYSFNEVQGISSKLNEKLLRSCGLMNTLASYYLQANFFYSVNLKDKYPEKMLRYKMDFIFFIQMQRVHFVYILLFTSSMYILKVLHHSKNLCHRFIENVDRNQTMGHGAYCDCF